MVAHAEACRVVGLIFIPQLMKTLGGWCEESIHTHKSIGRLQGKRFGISPAETTRHFSSIAIYFL